MMRQAWLLIAGLLALTVPHAAQAALGWRMIVASEDMTIQFDAATVKVDGAMRSFNGEMHFPKVDETGALGYAIPAQVDCAHRLARNVAVTAIAPNGSRRAVKNDSATFDKVEKGSYTEIIYDHLCAIEKQDGPMWGVALSVEPSVAAPAVFALLKLGLTSEQAAQLSADHYYLEEQFKDALDTYKVPAAKRGAVRLALAAQTTEIPKPPPPIVPLASAVATGRVGEYMHSAMELASGIWLKADGTFEYFLTVGSLDETARGRWTVEGARVWMVNEPKVVAPTIVAGPASVDLKVALSVKVVTPAGRGVQGVDIAVEFETGDSEEAYTQTDGWSLPLTEKRKPRFVTLSMSSYGLRSPRFPVGSANALTFVLNPNDFGVVDFTDIAVTVDKDDLVIRRQGSEMRYEKRKRRSEQAE